MSEPSTVGGLRLDPATARSSPLGTWHRATGADGPAGVLRIGADVGLEHLVAVTKRLRELELPGIVPIVDLVRQHRRTWLITAQPPSPTLADLMDTPDLDARRAVEQVGRTVLALHEAGLVHGCLTPASVVIGADEEFRLADWGLPGTVDGDVAAWAELARRVATARAAHDPDAAAALGRCAELAADAGLAAALTELQAPEPSATQLGERAAGRAAGVAAGERAGIRRFGPGVPPPAAPAWAEEAWREGAAAPARRRRARIVNVVITLVVVAIAAAVGLWLRQLPPLQVVGVDVRTDPRGPACDGTAEITGIITTNGGSGDLEYRWVRSDGPQPDDPPPLRVSGQPTVRVTLRWPFAGPQDAEHTARLEVLRPQQAAAEQRFVHRC
jgi:hypothetical protein